MQLKLLFLGFSLLIFSETGISQNLGLEVQGDKENGFYVQNLSESDLLLNNAGEFSLYLANLDRSVKKRIQKWKGSSFEETQIGYIIKKAKYLKEFDSNNFSKVEYERINSAIIKKTFRIRQNSIPNFYYSVDFTYVPSFNPKQYVSFAHENFQGGMVHELYPLAGFIFITDENDVVGFLTDPGYKNNFTRTTRRRFSERGGAMVGMRILPDAKILSTASLKEQDNEKHYIKNTFREALNLDYGENLEMQMPNSYFKTGDVKLKDNDSLRALGLEIEDNYVRKAEQEYRNFDDKERKHLLFDTDYIISVTDLFPEFLSLWVFRKPMLANEMVQKYLDQIPALSKVENSLHPEIGTTPIIVRLTDDEKGYTYMDEKYQPFGEFGRNNYGNNSRDGY